MGDIARAGVTGTSEYAAEERQGPFSPAGLLIMLLAMGVEAVVLYFILKPAPIALKDVRPGEDGQARTSVELLTPTVTLPQVVVSVEAKQGGTEMRTAIMGVAIKLGKIEGRDEEELDLRYLEKSYVPRVEALLPKLRHELIIRASAKSFNDLRRTEIQYKLLDDLKNVMNQTLRDYGIEPRITELYWDAFHFD